MMELDKSYDVSYFELEVNVREAYHEGIRKLRLSVNPDEQLKIFVEMFEILGKSRAGPDRGPEWVREIISAYRNLGRIFTEILNKGIDLSEGEYDGESISDRIISAIEDLKDIRNIMKTYNIAVEDLEERLAGADDELEKRLRSLEDI